MKSIVFHSGLAAVALAIVNSPFEARPEVSASVTIKATADFEAPLTSCGSWVEVSGRGRCWHPASIAVGWRPYCDGYWVWTDSGWYWMSDEPWAWACYHYGCWMPDPAFGWVWVPGLEWGPAWVSWRSGGGYVGWAPLPPPRAALVVSSAFVFVELSHFHERVRPTAVIVNNASVIARTAVVNNPHRENRVVVEGVTRTVVFNEGPGLAAVQKATANQVKHLAIQDAVRQTPIPKQESLANPTHVKDLPSAPVSPTEISRAGNDKKVGDNQPVQRRHPVRPREEPKSVPPPAPPKERVDKNS
jgi:hypothetical protein